VTVRFVITEIICDPRRVLLGNWNWKTAIFGATFRATAFLCANLTSGWRAATSAMLAEFLCGAALSGFYGALTQAFSEAEPLWVVALCFGMLFPAVPHTIELAVHLLRATPHVRASFIASVVFTILSSLFTLYAMRRGALVVGAEGSGISDDLQRMPRLLGGFLAAGPLAAHRILTVQAARATKHWRTGEITRSARSNP